MTKNKPALRDAIRDRLRELGLTQKEFAHEKRLDHNIFRAQLTRNTYSPHILEAAAGILTDGNEAKLGKLYEFGEAKRKGGSILSPTHSLKEQVGRTIKAPPSELTQNIQRLYSWLGPYDLAVICALDVAPLECTDRGWFQLQESITKAASEGTAFVYIRPNADVIRQQSEVLPEFFSKKNPREEYEELRKNLLASVGSDADAQRNVKENVKLYEAEWCPFWAIGMRFGFYSVLNEDDGSRDMTLFARFPFGGRYSGAESVDSKLLLFADQRMKNAFHSYLLYCFGIQAEFRPFLSRLR